MLEPNDRAENKDNEVPQSREPERLLEASTAREHARDTQKKNGKTQIRYVSLCGAVVFALSVVALALLQVIRRSEPDFVSRDWFILAVMICLLLAAWSSVVSLILAVCPLTRGDRRVLLWTVPLIVGWVLLLELFDWKSLVITDGTRPKADVASMQRDEGSFDQ